MPSWNRVGAKPGCRSRGESCKFREYNWGNFFFLISEPGRAKLPTLLSKSEMVSPRAHQAHWESACCKSLCLGKSMFSWAMELGLRGWGGEV